MTRRSGSSNLMKPWAWLATVAAAFLVLASSTALYVINPSVRLGLPWWVAVVAPALVYALVLPLCVPHIRLTGWLAGFFTLAFLHGALGLATAWLYASVGFTSFGAALAPAFWTFPPALVLEMVGSLLMTLPFLGAFAPPAAPMRAQPETPYLRVVSPKRPTQGVSTPQEPGRQAWARSEPPATPAVANLPAAPPPVVKAAPVVEESSVVAPEQPVVHAASLLGTNGSAVEPAPPGVEAIPDFRHALDEFLDDSAPRATVEADVEQTLEPPPPPAADAAPTTLSSEAPAWAPEAPAAPPVSAPVVEVPRVDARPATPPPAPVAPAAGDMVRISFDRVVGQLPPGAFRVPLAQVGSRLREPETLLVAQALIVPQLGEGVAQVEWEAVVEQFPAAVFAVPPAEVKERIVNGRLLLPLDEIVRQLPPDLFGASMARGPVHVPGIESFPAPFKPMGREEPAPVAPEVAPAPPMEAVAPASIPHVEPLLLVERDVPQSIEVPTAAEIAEDLKWPPPSLEPEPACASAPAAQADADLVLESVSESVMAGAAPSAEQVSPASTEPMPAEPVAAEAMVRISFDRVLGQLPAGAFRIPLGQVGARLRQPDTLLVPQALVVSQLGEGAVHVAWDALVGQFPAEILKGTASDVKDQIEQGQLLLPLDEIVRQLPPDVFGGAMARGPVHVPGIESFPAPFKPMVVPAPPEPVVAAEEPASAPVVTEPEREVVRPEIAPAPHPVPVAPLYEARVFERPMAPELPSSLPERRGHMEMVAALMAPFDAAAPEETQLGEFTIISMAAGMPGSTVAAAAGRLSPLMARGAPHPIEQVTLRGVGGALVLTPVGSGWTSGTTLAVGLRAGGALARVEMLARRVARHEPAAPATSSRGAAPVARLEATPTPPAIAAAVADLTSFGALAAESFREPASGAVVHCLVSPGVAAAELAPFAWELAQAMAQSAPAEALGVFHSAVLRSGSTRVDILRLPSVAGLALILVVGGTDRGRPGLARLQVERTAARLSVA